MSLESIGQDSFSTTDVLHFFFLSSPRLTLPLLFIETSKTQREREGELLYSQLSQSSLAELGHYGRSAASQSDGATARVGASQYSTYYLPENNLLKRDSLPETEVSEKCAEVCTSSLSCLFSRTSIRDSHKHSSGSNISCYQLRVTALRRCEKIEQCGGAHVKPWASLALTLCLATRRDVSTSCESQTLGLPPSLELEAEQLQALHYKYYHQTP